jgi:uncharacterized integral membrane protein (TIGR00698 family)
MADDRERVRALLPGLALLLAFAVVARVVGGAVPLVSPLILAIALGAVVANGPGLPGWAEAGVARHGLILETGIVLLGAQLALRELLQTGGVVLVLATAFVLLGVLYVEALARTVFGIGRGARAVLAAGASVCGVSAVLAVAGTVDVDEADVTYAVATVLLFDAVTLVAFPALAGPLGLSDRVFGVWAGLSLFSTGPTAAVGFAVSETAGQWATVTKLVRNSFIGVLAVAYALRAAAADADAGAGRVPLRAVWTRFPKFLVGFLVVVLVANSGLLSADAVGAVGTTTDWLFALAFVGLGFDIELDRFRDAGLRPVALVAVHLLTVAALALAAVTLLL